MSRLVFHATAEESITLPEEVPLMEAQTIERRTSIIDAKTGLGVPAKIRPVRPSDNEQLLDIGRSYMVVGDEEDHMISVLVTENTMGEVVEGSLSVKLSTFHGAKSLSVEGVDVSPMNMHDTAERRYKRVGTRLIEYAVHASIAMGCEGRIHAKSRDGGSDRFYDSLGFNGEGLRRDRDSTYYLPKKLVPKFLKRVWGVCEPKIF